jgi:phosphatidylglycerophosphatase A
MRAILMAVATCGGAGYAPVAPGTLGTLAAVPLFFVLDGVRRTSPATGWLALVALIAVAVWAAGAAERVLDETDSGRIVIDEVAGYLVATAFMEFSWWTAALAFCLFRLFDIVKPFPISWVERRLSGGVGVVADDVVAGAVAGGVAGILLYVAS